MKNLNTQFHVIDMQDFRNDRSNLFRSYLYRLAALFLFGGLFHRYIKLIHGELSFGALVNIEIRGVPDFLSVALLIANVIGVLSLHELIHAGVYYLTKRQRPEIGIRGFVVYAAAPGHLISRRVMLVNALAPFVLISTGGLTAMMFLSPEVLSWVFIPTLVNAAASAGDFMTVGFVLKKSKSTVFNDVGDIIYALQAEVDN